MERLQRWFVGGEKKNSELTSVKESNGEKVKESTAVAVPTDATLKHVKTTAILEAQTRTASQSHREESKPPEFPSDANVTETRVGQLLNEGREMILRVVPFTEGDCLSCKLIGSGVMWGAAAFVLFSYPKVKMRYTGFRRKLLVLQVGSLSTALTLLGAARFFDLSIFAPPDADGKRKSLGEMLTEDLKYFHKLSSQVFSSGGTSDSKKDS